MAKKPKSPTALLNNRQFNRLNRAETRYAFRPLYKELGREARASRNRQRSIGRMYRGLTGLDKRLAKGSAKDYANQATRYTGFLKAVGAQDAANAASTSAQQNAIATKYGGTASTAGQERANAAAAQRGLSAANYGGYSQQVGANNRAYLRKLASAHKHEGIGQQMIERQRARETEQKRLDLGKQRADFYTKTAAENRAAERDYKIQLMAFNKPSQSDITSRMQTRGGIREAQIQAGATKFQSRKAIQEQRVKNQGYKNLPGGRSGGKGKGGRPGGKKDRMRAMSILRATAAKGGASTSPYDTLVTQGVDPRVAKWAVHRWNAKRHPKPPKGRGPHGTQGPVR